MPIYGHESANTWIECDNVLIDKRIGDCRSLALTPDFNIEWNTKIEVIKLWEPLKTTIVLKLRNRLFRLDFA